MSKQYLVIGLGTFGKNVALQLENLGCDVLAVDKSMDRVEEIADYVTSSMCLDVTEGDAMRALRGKNIDTAVVSINESLEASIIATIMLKELGVAQVIAKARNDLQGIALKRVGADMVVYPERDMGERLANSLSTNAFEDWITLSDEYSMVEMPTPADWIGKSLIELNVRKKYGMNVVAIRTGENLEVNLDPEKPIKAGTGLIIIGKNVQLDEFRGKR